jgi:2-oxoglutarate/2-oxoacid ferredoxin oxidoreductase subunit alpha
MNLLRKELSMTTNMTEKTMLIDGSRLIIEAMARAGADVFIGYPITPANLLYSYGSQRMPFMMPAPDEITTLQWMSGLSCTGKLPVTATSFPGFALMLESINMAFMMELPMVIILVQRLGPATGTATCGAQGDLSLLRGMISGGHQLPLLCTSDFKDCWNLAARSVELAIRMRTPVVLLTSKEEVMTQKSFNPDKLIDIKPVQRTYFEGSGDYQSYQAGENLVPEFLPVGNNLHQVRINASTHDRMGILQHSTEDAMANTVRLENKARKWLPGYTEYDLFEVPGAETLVVSYGITADAARDAAARMNKNGKKASLFIPKTLLPVPVVYREIIERYKKVIVAEENINAQFCNLMYGESIPGHVRSLGSIGKMITPEQIIKMEEES